ncbi:hypothetical protein ACOACO_17670 [Nocardioides sp. CPCC 205120]|uniref:hypothetical protein n=1 Tax=Nocardioides sp. CPCC 205120 TaxID=3406462 RepID=UPI003B506370
MGRPNPIRRFRLLGGWILARHRGGPMGITLHDERVISLRDDLLRVEYDGTLLHEVIHAERGPTLDNLVEREELAVRRGTAQQLLPDVVAIGEALAWAQRRVSDAADELDVDVDVLWDRIDNLTLAELRYIEARLDRVWSPSA